MSSTILVCDDEDGLRQVLVNLLKPMGYRVIEAENGQKAIQQLSSQNPDLLLLDMRLPDMDGLEILGEAKRMTPSMPVVMLSGFGDVESAVGTIKRGAFDYLSKPFRVADVKGVVQKALASSTPGPTPVPSNVYHPMPGRKKKIIVSVLAFVGVLALGVMGWFFRDYLIPTAKDKVFTLPYSTPTALCFAGEGNLWISDKSTNNIYQHTLKPDLAVKQILPFTRFTPTSFAWDGRFLWGANERSGVIFKLRVGSDLRVVKAYRRHGIKPSSLFFDGTYLWATDTQTGRIVKLEITKRKLNVINEYDSPGHQPIGLFYREGQLWSVDQEKNTFYQHKNDLYLTVQKAYTVPVYDKLSLQIGSVGWDGTQVWTVAKGHAKLYQHNFKNLKEVKY